MHYLLLQVGLNLIAFTYAPLSFLRFYGKAAYFIFPLMIAVLLVYPAEGIRLNESNGFSLEITPWISWYFALLVLAAVLVQYAFNHLGIRCLQRDKK